jgi:hypothetical protein
MTDKICGTCRHSWFKRLTRWCKFHNREICGKPCDQWVDINQKDLKSIGKVGAKEGNRSIIPSSERSYAFGERMRFEIVGILTGRIKGGLIE